MFGECHAHIFMNGRNYREAVNLHKGHVCEAHIRASFLEYRKRGISFVRDGGDSLNVSATARRIAPEFGIDYRTPLFAVHRKKHYGGIVGFAYENMEEYTGLVEQVYHGGGDFIKIMVSGIMEFEKCGILSESSLPDGEIRDLVSIAHDRGFAVMVHANGAEAVRSAVLAGADSIEHGNYIDRDCVDAMAEMGTVWVPTAATIRNLMGSGRYPEEELHKIYACAAQNLSYAWEKGVLLALGSDAGAYMVQHGQGLLDEYAVFEELFGKTEKFRERLMEGESVIRRKFCRKENQQGRGEEA